MTKLAKDPSRFLAVLLLLFAGSGCSALIYEIVWYQLLQLVIGSSAISLGVLLATFMGGLCAGSLALPRMSWARREHPLRLYAKIEFGIGVLGVLVLFGMPLVDGVYTAAVGHGMPAILLRAAVCALCLMPPTFLMGASLPAAARWIDTTPEGVAWMGFLYGGNTAGAVFGCLLAGFYLLRQFSMSTATLVAAALNVAVGLGGFWVAGRTPETLGAPRMAAAGDSASEPGAGRRNRLPGIHVYLTIAISGACALGAEVIWTRLLGLMLGATVYTFSIILAVFLIGIGLGSGVGSALAREFRGTAAARRAFGVCQLLLIGAIGWTAFMISDSLPYWPVNPLLSTSPWFTFQIDLVRALWTILPAATLWGASFPLALAAAATRDEGCRQPGGRSLRGEYGRSDCGRAQLQPGAGAVDRDTGVRAPADRAGGGGRSHHAAGAGGGCGARLERAGGAGGGAGGGRGAGGSGAAGSGRPDRVRAADHDVDREVADSVYGRGHQFLDRHFALGRRGGAVPRQRQSGSLERAVRYAAAADAGAHAGAVPSATRNRCWWWASERA